jgi:hypothetical protein
VSRLRSYARLPRQSTKVKAGDADFRAVYADVDARSEGLCEVLTRDPEGFKRFLAMDRGEWRCARRAAEHHHLFKPRRSHHTAGQVIHACIPCHDQMEWPYKRGRLCYLGMLPSAQGPRFLFAVRFASSKFAARGQGE